MPGSGPDRPPRHRCRRSVGPPRQPVGPVRGGVCCPRHLTMPRLRRRPRRGRRGRRGARRSRRRGSAGRRRGGGVRRRRCLGRLVLGEPGFGCRERGLRRCDGLRQRCRPEGGQRLPGGYLLVQGDIDGRDGACYLELGCCPVDRRRSARDVEGLAHRRGRRGGSSGSRGLRRPQAPTAPGRCRARQSTRRRRSATEGAPRATPAAARSGSGIGRSSPRQKSDSATLAAGRGDLDRGRRDGAGRVTEASSRHAVADREGSEEAAALALAVGRRGGDRHLRPWWS